MVYNKYSNETFKNLEIIFASKRMSSKSKNKTGTEKCRLRRLWLAETLLTVQMIDDP